jgi:hypothetical protein
MRFLAAPDCPLPPAPTCQIAHGAGPLAADRARQDGRGVPQTAPRAPGVRPAVGAGRSPTRSVPETYLPTPPTPPPHTHTRARAHTPSPPLPTLPSRSISSGSTQAGPSAPTAAARHGSAPQTAPGGRAETAQRRRSVARRLAWARGACRAAAGDRGDQEPRRGDPAGRRAARRREGARAAPQPCARPCGPCRIPCGLGYRAVSVA